MEKLEETKDIESTEEARENMFELPYEEYSSVLSIDDFYDTSIKMSDFLEAVRSVSTMLNVVLSNIKYNSEISDQEKMKLTSKNLEIFNSKVSELITEYNSSNEGKFKELVKSVSDLMQVFKAKKYKTEGGVKFYANDFLYVPDPEKPSTWKLRIAEGSTGNVTIAQLGRASAAFSSGGFRGNKVQVPSSDVAKIKTKLRNLYKKLGAKDDEIPESISKETGMFLWKEKDGGYRWFAIYSNRYRDVDGDIISNKSHKSFVDAVEKGEIDYPELWHWHTKETAWGKADWIAYDEENGFALASGYVYDGHGAEAEALMNSKEVIGVSHGMPKKFLERDSQDKSIIEKHITREISDLPLWAAANKLTGFAILTEDNEMPIPEEKKEYLKSVGVSDEAIDGIDKAIASKAKQAEIENLDSKESANATQKQADTTSTSPSEESTKEAENVSKGSDNLTKEEVATTLADFMKQINESLDNLKKEIEGIKNGEVEKSSTVVEDDLTPTASLSAMIATKMRATMNKEAAVKKTDKFDTPVQKDAAEQEKQVIETGNPLLNSIISGIVSGK